MSPEGFRGGGTREGTLRPADTVLAAGTPPLPAQPAPDTVTRPLPCTAGLPLAPEASCQEVALPLLPPRTAPGAGARWSSARAHGSGTMGPAVTSAVVPAHTRGSSQLS